MQEQVNQQAIQQLMEWAKQAVDLGREQVPLIAQEIIRRAYFTDIFVLIICALAAIASFKILLYVHMGTEGHDDVIEYLGYWVIGVACGLFSTIFLMVAIADLISVITAPRLYVLNELAKFLK